MKKLVGIFTAVFVAAASTVVFADKAVISGQRLNLDGKNINVSGYNINGSNYFKLRDVAALMKDGNGKFSVEFNAEKGIVSVARGAQYTVQPDDLSPPVSSVTEASPSSQTLFVDGKEVKAEVYSIGDHNYFKLRDLGKSIGFGVDFDKFSNTVLVKSPEAANVIDEEPSKNDESLYSEIIAEKSVYDAISSSEEAVKNDEAVASKYPQTPDRFMSKSGDLNVFDHLYEAAEKNRNILRTESVKYNAEGIMLPFDSFTGVMYMDKAQVEKNRAKLKALINSKVYSDKQIADLGSPEIRLWAGDMIREIKNASSLKLYELMSSGEIEAQVPGLGRVQLAISDDNALFYYNPNLKFWMYTIFKIDAERIDDAANPSNSVKTLIKPADNAVKSAGSSNVGAIVLRIVDGVKGIYNPVNIIYFTK